MDGWMDGWTGRNITSTYYIEVSDWWRCNCVWYFQVYQSIFDRQDHMEVGSVYLFQFCSPLLVAVIGIRSRILFIFSGIVV